MEGKEKRRGGVEKYPVMGGNVPQPELPIGSLWGGIWDAPVTSLGASDWGSWAGNAEICVSVAGQETRALGCNPLWKSAIYSCVQAWRGEGSFPTRLVGQSLTVYRWTEKMTHGILT